MKAAKPLCPTCPRRPCFSPSLLVMAILGELKVGKGLDSMDSLDRTDQKSPHFGLFWPARRGVS